METTIGIAAARKAATTFNFWINPSFIRNYSVSGDKYIVKSGPSPASCSLIDFINS